MKTERFAGCAMLVTTLLVAGNARADTPNNTPGVYIIESTADSRIYFADATSWAFAYNTGGTYSDLFTYIDGSGNVTMYAPAAHFNAEPVSGSYDAQLVVSNDTGLVDFWAGAPFHITITAVISFSGGGLSAPCQTPSFSVEMKVGSAAGTYVPAGQDYGGGGSPTGRFRAGNPNFTVPAVTSGCGSAANIAAINSALKLGVNGTHEELIWYGIVNPLGYGSP